VRALAAGLEPAVAQSDRLLAQAFQAEVGVGGAEGRGLGQRGLCERFAGQREEVITDGPGHPREPNEALKSRGPRAERRPGSLSPQGRGWCSDRSEANPSVAVTSSYRGLFPG